MYNFKLVLIDMVSTKLSNILPWDDIIYILVTPCTVIGPIVLTLDLCSTYLACQIEPTMLCLYAHDGSCNSAVALLRTQTNQLKTGNWIKTYLLNILKHDFFSVKGLEIYLCNI